MSKVRWGILGTAKIAVEKVIPAMQQAEHCEIVAIASRDGAKARAAAERLQIPKAHASYEALLAADDIDAVYIPLPNHLHVPWSINALEAGKHVLCEKPIGLTAGQGRQLVEASKRFPGLKVMEAFMYRHHPQWQKARELVDNGQIGTLKTIQSFFSYFNDDPANIRNQVDIGGGGLMDIGCYPVSLSRYLFREEPERVLGIREADPQFETDRVASAILDFGRGTSTFTCSTQMVPYQRVNIFGTEGRIEIEIPFNAPSDTPCKMWHERGGTIGEFVFDVCDQYGIQGDVFSLAVINKTAVPTPIEDAVANLQVIEAIIASAFECQWMSPEL